MLVLVFSKEERRDKGARHKGAFCVIFLSLFLMCPPRYERICCPWSCELKTNKQIKTKVNGTEQFLKEGKCLKVKVLAKK